MVNSGGMWKNVCVSAPFAIQLAPAIFRNTACTSTMQANLHDSQHRLHVNRDCGFFLQYCLHVFFCRIIVNFFCNCACMFFCPKLREFCRMAICAGAGFSRTVNYFYYLCFFYLTNMAGCCIITVPFLTKGIPKNQHDAGFFILAFLNLL